MEENIIFRKVISDDVNGLVKLFDLIWPNEEYDKFEKTQFILKNNSQYSYCALLNNKIIIGSRMSLKEPLYLSTTLLNCIQVCDTCTHPQFRGRGIMGNLNKLLLRDFFSEGGDLIFNIGENASRRVNEHYGWKYVQSLHTLLKILHPSKVIRTMILNKGIFSRNIKWEKNDRVTSIENYLLHYRENIIRKAGKLLHVFYDEKVIAWKLSSNKSITIYQDSKYGTIVYKVGNCEGLRYVVVGEVFLTQFDRKTFNRLMKSFCQEINPDIIKTAVSMGHPMYKYFKLNFFLKYKTLNLGFRTENDQLRDICFDNKSWAISTLDFDTF